MKAARFWVPLLGALLAFGGALWGLWWWTTMHQALAPVLVASRDLSSNQLISQSDLTVLHLPRGSVDPQSLQSTTDLVGHVLLSPVYSGEQLRRERVAPASGVLVRDNGAVEDAVGPDQAELTIPVDLAGANAGRLSPGETVDLWSVPRGGSTDPMLVAAGATLVEVRTSTGGKVSPGALAVPAALVVRVASHQVQPLLLAIPRGSILAVLTGRPGGGDVSAPRVDSGPGAIRH